MKMTIGEYRQSVGPSEENIQAAFFQWISINKERFPQLYLCFAVANGTYKSPAARMLHKRTGLIAGIPDVCLAHSGSIGGKRYNALLIEFKAKRGVLSDVQRNMIDRLREANNYVAILRSWDAAANLIIKYLSLPIEKI